MYEALGSIPIPAKEIFKNKLKKRKYRWEYKPET